MNLLKHVTVEPTFLISLIVYEWLEEINANLYLQKTCRLDRTHEPDLRTKCDNEKEGILFVSEMKLKFQSVIMLCCAIFVILAMPWSDRAGRRRRPLIFMPILSMMLQSLSGCLHSYFWQWAPVAAAISCTTFACVGGGALLLIPACQIYICDVCAPQERTTRLGIVGAVQLSSLILGRGATGVILRQFGFFYSYLLCFALLTTALILGLLFIKDASVEVEKKEPFYRVFTNCGPGFVDNFKVVFHKNLGSKRIIVSLLFLSNVAIVFTYFGELSVLYQYLRYRFGWNERTYSDFMFYKFSASAFGIIFCSVVLSKYFKVHDGLIGILAGLFDTVAVVCLLIASQVWQIYLIPLIDLFHGTALMIGMSFTSKFYDVNELGRVSAVNNVFALMIAFSYPSYNEIYRQTLDTFPSAFCLLSISLDIVILLCFCGAYFLSKKLDNSSKKMLEKSTPVNHDFPGDKEVTTPLPITR